VIGLNTAKRLGVLLVATLLLVGAVPMPALAFYLLQPTGVTPATALPAQTVTVCFTLGDDDPFSNNPYVVEAWFGPKDEDEFYNCPPLQCGYSHTTPFHSPFGNYPPGWFDRYSDLNTDGMTKIYENDTWPDGTASGTQYCFDYTLPGDLMPGKRYYIYLIVGYTDECENWTHYQLVLEPGGTSFDLDGQATGKCVEASVKVHPTIWMDTLDCDTGAQVDEYEYKCLNPLDNPSTSFCFDWVVRSNLPFYKQVEFGSFTWSDPQPEALQSYEYDAAAGEWVLVSNPAGAGPDDGPPSRVLIDGVEIQSGWVSDKIGDVDNHEDIERIEWTVGPIDWCTTAGYYESTICLSAYQN
jgi:hypothetical protein